MRQDLVDHRFGHEAREEPADALSLLLEIPALQVAQAFGGEAAVDSCAQKDRVERLGQVVGRSHLDAAHDAFDVLERRDHDYGNASEPLVVLYARECLISVQLGHEHVEQDDVERCGVKCLQRRCAVLGGSDTVALSLRLPGEHHAVDRVVVDDEERGGSLGHVMSRPAARNAPSTRTYSPSSSATRWAAPGCVSAVAIASSS